MRSAQSAGSAYGFRVNIAAGGQYLNPLDASLPRLTVSFERSSTEAPDSSWQETRLGRSWVVWVSPDGKQALCCTDPPYAGDGIVHPGLGAAAVATTLHLGGDAVHAGTLLTPSGALGLLAARGSGKTTTLGYLSTRLGIGVLADDQLMIRDGVAHAGPRCLDLRPQAAEGLGLQDRTKTVRNGARHRHLLADVPLTAPVCGLVVLEWGDKVHVETVPPRERLALLGRHRTLPGQLGGRLLPLHLATLPMRRLTRPRGLEHLPAVARALLDG